MANLAPATILYVDDEEGSRLAFSHLFRKEGYEVREAATGGEALRLVAEKPDLVVLDVNLPDINGFEVCRRIKAHPATRSIPVLHMSGVFTSTEDRTHGLEGGADGYVSKPVEPREVMATVRALLRVHRAEEAARTAALQWQATFDAISDALCLVDPNGKLLRCNQAMATLLGKPPRGLIGQPYAPICKERLEGPDLLLLERVRETGCGASAELPLAGRWFRIEVDPVLDEQGTFLGSVHLFIDLTERKQLEEQLRQAQKMEAIGRLAGGVAHDFNNLLTGITGNVSLLLAQTPPADPRYELLLPVDKAAWRAAELTRQLLGFSRRTLLWLKPTNLKHALDEVVGLLARTLNPQIVLNVASPTDLWTVQADPGQINQVLLNLCLNARDAMPEGGRLLMETANIVVEPGKTSAHPDARSGEFVRLRVADTGHGIPEELLSSIFEPFFTTKPAGQGTGLGLAMVFGMVKQHHGWIECHSEVDKGTTFDMYLPRFIATEEPETQPTKEQFYRD
jgi:two-component system, cell cycle sensor histidine kinase and response regulator CckA